MIFVHCPNFTFFNDLGNAIASAIPNSQKFLSLREVPRVELHNPNNLFILTWYTYLETPSLEKIQAPYIIYNTEKLSQKLSLNPGYKHILDNAFKVYDYSLKTKEYYAKAEFVPIKFSNVWTSKKWDCLFYGAINGRRKHIFNQLEAKGLRVYGADGLTRGEMESLITDSWIVLSIHYNDFRTNDGARIWPALSRGALVVAEECDEPEYNAWISQYCKVVPYNEIANTCEDVLFSNKEKFHFPVPEKFK